MLPAIGSVILGGVVGGLMGDNNESTRLSSSARIYEAEADAQREYNSELTRTLDKMITTKSKAIDEVNTVKLARLRQKTNELERIINEQLEIYKNTTDIKDKEKIKEVIIKLKEQALKGK